MFLSSVLALVTACDGGDNGKDEAGDETGDSGSNTSGSNTSGGNTSGGNTDGGADVCDDACLNLESCGIPVDECVAFCLPGECGTCLANSDSCGQDCAAACAGGGDGDGDPSGDGDGDPSGDGDGDTNPIPPKECVINNDCGISFECVSCNLTDNEGWCEQSSDCQFDEDCGFGGKCGYNVETAAWRCLPAEYCG